MCNTKKNICLIGLNSRYRVELFDAFSIGAFILCISIIVKSFQDLNCLESEVFLQT